jgi:hypothetical protein
MARSYYKPGDYNVICDRCGGQYKRSECAIEWNGLLTCLRGCWEIRQPQDFVRAKEDNQSVSLARVDINYEMSSTTLASSAVKDATVVQLTDSATKQRSGDSIGVGLNDGTIFWTFVTETPTDSNVSINNGLWTAADSGNIVYLGGSVA